MSRIDELADLRDVAAVYLNVAHRSDQTMSDTELEKMTQVLAERSSEIEREDLRALVMESLEAYLDSVDADEDARAAAERLHHALSREQKEAVLVDLKHIAEADGVALQGERRMLGALADIWGLELEVEDRPVEIEGWGVLHDLAYIFLVLAHGTDNDLTETEAQVMLNKLKEWRPEESSYDMRSVLEAALDVYAAGEDEEQLERSIGSVRQTLPREQRMAALNDLVKIANADGIFLDNEEDLINHLLAAWDVDPYANYGAHGSKE